MKTKRLRSAQNKVDPEGPNLIDFISKMPDDVLVMILSCLPIKRAVITSSSFSGSFRLDSSCSQHIDEWIHFALDKKIEKLDLYLSHESRDRAGNYEFKLPSSNGIVGAMQMSFKKIFLYGVNLNEPTLNAILKNSPFLEKLSVCVSDLYAHIHVGGQGVNLKRLIINSCSGVESIVLYGFDLVSFLYSGSEIQLRLVDLPKLKELDIGEVNVGFENNVFSQISSCALYLEVLVLNIGSAKKGLNVNAILKLPKVKKLMLIIGAEEDDSLLEYTSIAQACLSLETFSISLHWCSLMKKRRKVRHVAAPHLHKHLKFLEIIGYYGRISDLELAVYVIDNAVALKKITIDPCCHASEGRLTREDFLKREQAARCSAKRQITPLLPPGVDLAIL
ncbi:hypothetical protein QVD17_08032 [Tagetes erecta]|uniref:At1g61320/AtMIF1 LRR domain-containing protein n=1 Tax=Tagetes erecta TaxID=13708 RepID=A0AAD8KYL3_TARER|nr:hypothetical protein QVD17_08032 [Tagetes erecta]